MMIKRSCHYLIATIVWGVPAIIITKKGVAAYNRILPDKWWLFAITIGVLIGFYYIFRKVVRRYFTHIDALPQKSHIWRTFPLRGWLLIIFMIGLGITLKYIEAVPIEFTASFYSGLGPMLFWSALQFARRV